MVQVLPYVPGFGEQLAQALGGAAENIGQGYLQGRENRQDQTILQQLTNPEKPLTPMEQIHLVGRLSKQGADKIRPLIQQNLANEQKRQQSVQNNPKVLFQQGKAIGMDDATATELANAPTEGARSKIVDYWKRSQERSLPSEEPELNEEGQPIESAGEQFKITPGEKFAQEQKRFDKQLPIYEDYTKKVKAADDEQFKLDIAEEINNNEDLPSGWERLNVDWTTGDIRVPALATPAAQRFAKTIADFLSSAKDTFGARVTNFDIDQFKRRLPSLANTKDGREVIISQMKIINRLNRNNAHSVISEFDKAGGIRKIDYDKVIKRADKRQKQGEESARKQLAVLNNRSRRFVKDDVEARRKNLPEGYTLMMSKEGEFVGVPSENVVRAQDKGYEKL